jgi:hypothetical protein
MKSSNHEFLLKNDPLKFPISVPLEIEFLGPGVEAFAFTFG